MSVDFSQLLLGLVRAFYYADNLGGKDFLVNISSVPLQKIYITYRKWGEIMAKVKVDINEYASSQPSKVRAWISKIDKLMVENNCRVVSSVVSNKKRTDGKFTYTSKRTKKSVCIINLGTSGNYISMRGNHFIYPKGKENILDALPEDVLDFVIKGAGCELGHCLNLDYSVNQDNYCVHGNAEVFEYSNQKSHRCPHNGWRFDLIETTNFEMLSKWIALEVTW